jgi:hypothetical protein
MKVNIGKHKSWIGPYQIAEALCFWAPQQTDEHGFKSKPHWVHEFGTWLSETKTGEYTALTKMCQWVESKRKRRISVRIHDYDTWNMDATLALIVLPMLKQLRAGKHGAPYTDDSDVPDNLKSTSAPPKENEYDTDDFHHLRWDYVLDEMIHAFECKNSDTWEDVYHTGEIDFVWVPSDDLNSKGKPRSYTMEHGPKHTHQCDYEALKAHQARITNGFRLFGKYYENLWD